jgi:phosphohistidine phosphatase
LNLYLVQHAKARSESKDPERHLSKRGREAIRKTAGFAADRAAVQVTKILHSGKTRARETAEALAEAIRLPLGVGATDALDPMADPKVWAERVAGSAEDLMLVGHLPHMSRLAALLVCGDADKPVVTFQTGGIVCLRTDEEGQWSVAWMVVPELL